MSFQSSLQFSIPGKTFIAGEYLALQEGPSLVFLSQPCFKIGFQKGTGQHSFHAESPAGQFIQRHADLFSKIDIDFQDPYQGRGGFGASTAQFLACYAFSLIQEVPHQDMQKLFDIKHLLETYYKVAWKGEGQRPSGADLIGQLKGALTFFEKRRGMIAVTGWPFSGLEFYVLHTGNKVATHEHLKGLKEFDASELEKAMALIRKSFEAHSEDMFVEGISEYAKALEKLNFTCDLSRSLLSDIRGLDGVLTAKACGALGADVLIVVTKTNEAQAFKSYCQTKGLAVVASNQDLASGLQMHVKDHL